VTSDQYKLLLQDLARVAGLVDSSGLVDHGRVKIGEVDAVLEHNPDYDDNLLQVRMRMGTLPEEGDDLVRAILEANYVSGYGGECVFSLYPASDDVVVTMRFRLVEALSPQELWQAISDIARHGSQMWEGIVAVAQTSQAATPSDLRPPPGIHA
jgi:hypothetical protein